MRPSGVWAGCARGLGGAGSCLERVVREATRCEAAKQDRQRASEAAVLQLQFSVGNTYAYSRPKLSLRVSLNVLQPKNESEVVIESGLDATAASCVTTMRAPLLFALAATQLCDALSATTPIKLHVEFCQQ